MDFEEKYKRKVDYNIEYLRGIKGSIKEKFDIKKYLLILGMGGITI